MLAKAGQLSVFSIDDSVDFDDSDDSDDSDYDSHYRLPAVEFPIFETETMLAPAADRPVEVQVPFGRGARVLPPGMLPRTLHRAQSFRQMLRRQDHILVISPSAAPAKQDIFVFPIKCLFVHLPSSFPPDSLLPKMTNVEKAVIYDSSLDVIRSVIIHCKKLLRLFVQCVQEDVEPICRFLASSAALPRLRRLELNLTNIPADVPMLATVDSELKELAAANPQLLVSTRIGVKLHSWFMPNGFRSLEVLKDNTVIGPFAGSPFFACCSD
jgi:hypothetical protein